jgi:hypothetical protein
VAGIEKLHERLVQLLMAGLHPDPAAAQFRLLTAKLAPAQLSALKKTFVRSDLIAAADALENEAKAALQQISSKEGAKPSQLWKMLHAMKPEGVLWLFFTTKSASVQSRFENFFTKWPEARQKIPNALLQEMRITPDVPGYSELLDKLTFGFMDGELPDDAAIRKLAEPYSPPAPPPVVNVRRNRAVKRVVEPRGTKSRGKKQTDKESAGEGVAMAASQAEGAEAAALATVAKPQAARKAAAPAKKAAPSAQSSKAPQKTAPTVKPAAKSAPAAGKPGAAKPAAKAVKAPAKPEKKTVAPAKNAPAAKRKPEAANRTASKGKAEKTKPAPAKAAAKQAAAKPGRTAAPVKKSAAKSAKPAKAASKAGGKAAEKSKARR